MSKPRREIQAFAGYDKRETGHGIGGMTFWFTLRRGDNLAIRWELLTDIFPASVTGPVSRGSTAGAVTLHTSIAFSKDWYWGPSKCELIPSGQCWSNTGYLVGDDVYAALREGGQDAVFERLDAILTDWIKPDEPDEATA